MTNLEIRCSVGIAVLYALRLFGMFLILPIFGLYAAQLTGGSSHVLVGLSFGVYGIAQAIMQIPLGWFSDHVGRKTVIALGLFLLGVGSLVCASATHIHTIICGRILQGLGAYGSAASAWLSDLTQPAVRGQAMAVVGITIGITFMLSFVLGPILGRVFGVSGIFSLTGLCALLGLVILYGWMPRESEDRTSSADFRVALQDVVVSRKLWMPNMGIFVLHACLMALWAVIPFQLEIFGYGVAMHWEIYLPILLIAFSIAGGVSRAMISPERIRVILIAAILCEIFSQVLFCIGLHHVFIFFSALLFFFVGFVLLETSLPAFVSLVASPQTRGTALGVLASCQYMGIFFGSVSAGLIFQHIGVSSIFVLCSVLFLIWLAVV